jgi:alpha-tubulin suppressor-like RCC1 family protein
MLGHASTSDVHTPKLVPEFDGSTASTTAVGVSLGYGSDVHGLVLTEDGAVWSFGANSGGHQLGRPSSAQTPGIVNVDGHGARFRQKFTLEDAIEFHAFAPLEALAGL